MGEDLEFSKVQLGAMLIKVQLEELQLEEVARSWPILILFLRRAVFYKRLSLRLCVGLRAKEVGDDGFVLDRFDFAHFRRSLCSELVIVFVAGMQVEGRKSQIVFAALTIKNLISLL